MGEWKGDIHAKRLSAVPVAVLAPAAVAGTVTAGAEPCCLYRPAGGGHEFPTTSGNRTSGPRTDRGTIRGDRRNNENASTQRGGWPEKMWCS